MSEKVDRRRQRPPLPPGRPRRAWRGVIKQAVETPGLWDELRARDPARLRHRRPRCCDERRLPARRSLERASASASGPMQSRGVDWLTASRCLSSSAAEPGFADDAVTSLLGVGAGALPARARSTGRLCSPGVVPHGMDPVVPRLPSRGHRRRRDRRRRHDRPQDAPAPQSRAARRRGADAGGHGLPRVRPRSRRPSAPHGSSERARHASARRCASGSPRRCNCRGEAARPDRRAAPADRRALLLRQGLDARRGGRRSCA